LDFLNGRNRGEYWLFKSDHFDVPLKSISETFTGGITAKVSESSVALAPELSLEELVRQAVVYLKGLGKSGSGFFRHWHRRDCHQCHLARGEESLHTLLPTGRELEGKVVYIDAELDIALVKVASAPTEIELPHLTLADASTVHQGESVIAIGNPGDAMLFSVTKGIVSAVGTFPAPVPAPGFRPTRQSIPVTAAARCSIPAAKSSASTRKNSSRKMLLASALPSVPPICSKSSTASIPTPCR